ncbi:hypothetical protein GGF46_000314 [Coemansia sp. RSA 552]|nr:hypothetical protein GGF46_000314 [Coemansia sp. RSA 552]
MCTKQHPTLRLCVRSVFQCNECNFTSEDECMKQSHEKATGHYDWSYMHYIN